MCILTVNRFWFFDLTYASVGSCRDELWAANDKTERNEVPGKGKILSADMLEMDDLAQL